MKHQGTHQQTSTPSAGIPNRTGQGFVQKGADLPSDDARTTASRQGQ